MKKLMLFYHCQRRHNRIFSLRPHFTKSDLRMEFQNVIYGFMLNEQPKNKTKAQENNQHELKFKFSTIFIHSFILLLLLLLLLQASKQDVEIKKRIST